MKNDINNKFSNLTEEELIEILNRGNLEEDEFRMLLQSMEASGLKGSIMAVPDPDSEEGRTAKEYIDYHKKLPNTYPKISEEDINLAKKNLLNKDTSMEKKKISLITLAHIGRLDTYQTLEEYEKNPDQELKIWLNMAIQECQSFLKSEIMDEPMIDISKVTKVGRNDPCPCKSGKKYKKRCGG